MEMLDIKVVTNERDFSDLYMLKNLANQYHIREGGRYFGVARLDDLPVGYWNGILSKEVFNSRYIFVAENYQNRGFGRELKKHQLKFAKSLGCSFAMSVVNNSNLKSWAIQEKCGGEIEVYDKESCFTFDLRYLNF